MAQLFWTLICASSALVIEDTGFRNVVQHGQEQAPLPAGQCVKDTSQSCRHVSQGDLLDHLTQCLGGKSASFLDPAPGSMTTSPAKQASCSADTLNMPSGTCICGEGYCADTDLLCHRGSYQVINEIFTITTKAFPGEKLYMTPDGKVKIGVPPDYRAAQWRISVSGQGVKNLWTELYSDTILQEYESCQTLTDAYGLSFSNCDKIVGHTKDPRAGEMGWYVEIFGDGNPMKLGVPETSLQLRAASSWNMFYIDWVTKEGKACETRARNCPGDSGGFIFDPPLLGRMDFAIDRASGSLPPGLSAYRNTVGIVLVLFCCITCVFSTSSSTIKSAGHCLMIPFHQFARSMGFQQGAYLGGAKGDAFYK